MIDTIDEIRERVAPVAEKWQVPKLYLFGSFSRGDADEHSDIDLAFVDRDSKIVGLIQLNRFQQELKEALQREVDVLELDQVNQVRRFRNRLKEHFDQEKVLVFEK